MINMTSVKTVFEKSFFLGTSECDINGCWKLSSLLEIVQNTANEHGQSLHIWHGDLHEKNLSWVLFKTDLHVDRYPRLGETVRVQSFFKDMRFSFLPRYCIIKDETGKVIVRFGSLLTLIDLTTRKAVFPKEKGVILPEPSELEAPLRISMKQRAVEGTPIKSICEPQYSDLDVNGHVNNIKYADWLCNCLGIQILKQFEIEYASINYCFEVLPNERTEQTLTVHEKEFQYCCFSEERRSTMIYGTLRDKVL